MELGKLPPRIQPGALVPPIIQLSGDPPIIKPP